MSRIWKLPIVLPEKVEVTIQKNTIAVKGPLGEQSFTYLSDVSVKQEENELIVSLENKENPSIWGTSRAIIAAMVEWVATGFKKSLEIQWVGYKFEMEGEKLVMSLGFSHKVEVLPPKGIKVSLDEKEKNTIHVFGIDKHLVWEFASKIKAMKKPEPYKGKGIRFVGEQVRRKAGKSGK
jgi:large subunit ribosomal protein L6